MYSNEVIKFIYPEKATKFCEISTRFDWHYRGQIYGEDFAEYMNFNNGSIDAKYR